jgi:hypothetical protein
VNGETVQGHHTYPIAQHPHLAHRGEGIWPATAREHLAGWHGGKYTNSTPGVPINPTIVDF